MSDGAAVRDDFAQQARWCRELGSPFTALLCATVAERLDRTTAVGARVLNWSERADPGRDALPLRLAGGLHALVRRGRLPALAALYPPHAMPDAEALWATLATSLADAGEELAPWLDRPPQTNEVARAAAFMAGLLVLARHTGLPVALYELGASAGLNLMPDRFAHRLGTLACGAPGSRVRLAPAWTGPPPPAAEVRILRRHGVDLAPLDATDPAARERLLAYVWADQAERLARVEAALAIAAAEPPALDRADAADWVEARLAPAPEAGVTRVMLHSIALHYMPLPARERIAAHAAAVGARASATAPFAWLSYEIEPALQDQTVLRLRSWPGGEDRVLATGDPHARALVWLGG